MRPDPLPVAGDPPQDIDMATGEQAFDREIGCCKMAATRHDRLEPTLHAPDAPAHDIAG
jgi:hypothetical protein